MLAKAMLEAPGSVTAREKCWEGRGEVSAVLEGPGVGPQGGCMASSGWDADLELLAVGRRVVQAGNPIFCCRRWVTGPGLPGAGAS